MGAEIRSEVPDTVAEQVLKQPSNVFAKLSQEFSAHMQHLGIPLKHPSPDTYLKLGVSLINGGHMKLFYNNDRHVYFKGGAFEGEIDHSNMRRELYFQRQTGELFVTPSLLNGPALEKKRAEIQEQGETAFSLTIKGLGGKLKTHNLSGIKKIHSISDTDVVFPVDVK